MAVTEPEKELIALLARYSFLEQLKYKGVITEAIFERLLYSFGTENLERINCFERCINEQYKDISAFLSPLINTHAINAPTKK